MYENNETLLQNPPHADVYLSGSDQVWNPLTIHDEFFFPFVQEKELVVSYAASMGTETVPVEHEALFSQYMARFDSISVREDTMVDVIRKYTDKSMERSKLQTEQDGITAFMRGSRHAV